MRVDKLQNSHFWMNSPFKEDGQKENDMVMSRKRWINGWWVEDRRWASYLSYEEMEGAHGKDETFKHLEERQRTTGSPSKPQLLFVVVKAT